MECAQETSWLEIFGFSFQNLLETEFFDRFDLS